MDESALNRYCQEIWSAALPTLEHSNGQAIIISNPSKDKPGWGWTRDLYTGSMKGQNKFKRLFLDWKTVPGRGENFLALQKEAGLSDDDISMQYPTTEEEALAAASGGYFKDTLKGFQPEDPEYGVLEKDMESNSYEFRPAQKGEVAVWEHPVHKWHHRYAIGSDVSEGLGQTYSVAYVYDRVDQLFVARIRSNLIDADIWADRLLELAKYYCNAMIGVERNGAGITTVIRLKDSNYPFLFYRKRPGRMKGEMVQEYGWQESNENKQILADELRRHYREVMLRVPCAVLIDESSTFIRHEDGKLAHEDGKLDDCVIAAGIALQVTLIMPPPKALKRRPVVPYHDRRIERILKGNQDAYEDHAMRDHMTTVEWLRKNNQPHELDEEEADMERFDDSGLKSTL
jgi:hypothetical protein